ncbi:MAG: S41 family peptidase [Erysipelotrichales bacterium]|nr:S41 family peptidase [Erysipelotrichales bacterium]
MKKNPRNKRKKNNFKINKFSLIEVIIITLAFCSLTSVIVGLSVYLLNNRNLILDNELLDIVNTYNKIKDNFYEEVDKKELATSAIEGMMKTLNEKYSIYLDEDNSSDLNEKLEGEYQGIGVTVRKSNEIFSIEKVHDNTPAYDAGLKEGDILLQINDYEIKGTDSLDYIKSLIKKVEKVTFKIKRNEEIISIDVKVKTIEYPSISYKTYERNNKNIGYIYISTFSKTTTSQVKDALKHLEDDNIESLIFDVRGNTGGYLNIADDILNMFMKKGTILYAVDDNNGTKKIYDTTKESRTYDIVVLIDQATASASEILATSLKESYGAILVGAKTFGKGLVQQVSSLSDNTLIKYTTAKWYTPDGNYINEIGYKPDIEVYLTKEYLYNPTDENDLQLQKALEVLSK